VNDWQSIEKPDPTGAIAATKASQSNCKFRDQLAELQSDLSLG